MTDVQLISDLGSGLNYRKKGLRQLLRLMAGRQFNHLVLTHKDRLLCFGSELIFEWCRLLEIQVSWIYEQVPLAESLRRSWPPMSSN